MITEIKIKDCQPDKVGRNGITAIYMHPKASGFVIVGEKAIIFKPSYTIEYVVGKELRDFLME